MTTPTSHRTINQPLTEVYRTELGYIVIQQESPMNDEQLVVIDPLFVPKLIQWLKELATLIQNDTK